MNYFNREQQNEIRELIKPEAEAAANAFLWRVGGVFGVANLLGLALLFLFVRQQVPAQISNVVIKETNVKLARTEANKALSSAMETKLKSAAAAAAAKAASADIAKLNKLGVPAIARALTLVETLKAQNDLLKLGKGLERFEKMRKKHDLFFKQRSMTCKPVDLVKRNGKWRGSCAKGYNVRSVVVDHSGSGDDYLRQIECCPG